MKDVDGQNECELAENPGDQGETRMAFREDVNLDHHEVEVPGGDLGYHEVEVPGGDLGHHEVEVPGGDLGHHEVEGPGGDLGHHEGEVPGGDLGHHEVEVPGGDLGHHKVEVPGEDLGNQEMEVSGPAQGAHDDQQEQNSLGNTHVLLLASGDKHILHFYTAFQPIFAHFKRSRYADKFIMITDLSQMSALEQELGRDENDEVFSSSYHLIHPQNPCQTGLWLVGIERGIY